MGEGLEANPIIVQIWKTSRFKEDPVGHTENLYDQGSPTFCLQKHPACNFWHFCTCTMYLAEPQRGPGSLRVPSHMLVMLTYPNCPILISPLFRYRMRPPGYVRLRAWYSLAGTVFQMTRCRALSVWLIAVILNIDCHILAVLSLHAKVMNTLQCCGHIQCYPDQHVSVWPYFRFGNWDTWQFLPL